jgi:hypothetical protein
MLTIKTQHKSNTHTTGAGESIKANNGEARGETEGAVFSNT